MAIEQNALREVVANILPLIRSHSSRRKDDPSIGPFILGLTGLQGSGKSTWASSLVESLMDTHHLRAITVSLDDFYHTHSVLVSLRETNPSNKLLSVRGQPGTHDEKLGETFFVALSVGKQVRVPRFDKSMFDGEGDRAPESKWTEVDGSGTDVVVFEGWCLGFRPLDHSALEEKWESSVERSKKQPELAESPTPTETLHLHALEHLHSINENLRRYNGSFMNPESFDAFVHLDTEDLRNVYSWRLEQETKLRQARGTGMSDLQVAQFIQNYMPAYELYLEGLRRESLLTSTDSRPRKHLRILLDRARHVVEVQIVG